MPYKIETSNTPLQDFENQLNRLAAKYPSYRLVTVYTTDSTVRKVIHWFNDKDLALYEAETSQVKT